jgi:uncharacterized protein (DUF2062 family)
MASFHRVRGWLEQLLHTHDTPARTALAYGLGVFFGFSPFLGLHTVLGLAFAFALNLNRVAVLLGVYSNLPWIIVPYYSLATWLGAALLGTEVPPGVAESMVEALEDRSWTDFQAAIGSLRPFVWAFTLGSTIGSVLLALIAYRTSFTMIVAHRKHRRHPQDTEM